MTRTPPLVAALAAVLLAPAAARAGTYTVYACHAAGREWNNGGFAARPAPGFAIDDDCRPGPTDISVNVAAGTSGVAPAAAALVFSAPQGDTIADFRLLRRLRFNAGNPPPGSHAFYEAAKLGATVYEGVGDYDEAVKSALSRQGKWHVSSEKEDYAWVSRSSFPALAGYKGKAATLSLEAGCFPRANPCALPKGGVVDHALAGAEIAIADAKPPKRLEVEAYGLLSGGPKAGTEPVRADAADSAGIQRLELVDVTSPAAPQVVAEEDYTQRATDRGATCDFRLAAPCPVLNQETVAAGGIPPGERQLAVRAVDPAGNVTQRGPYVVDVLPPPADRGPLNGAGATETATLRVRFAHGPKTSRTVSYGAHVTVSGRVTNATGAAVGGAKVEVLSADLRLGAQWKRRATVSTHGDGRFSYRATAGAARRLQFGWKSHVNDGFFSARGEVRLWARASGRLSVRPHVTGPGGRIRFSGRLRGYRFPQRGKLVELQAFERGRWRTFDTVRASRYGAFAASYRFSSAAGGRSFTFRARIRRESTFPYSLGYTNETRVTVH